MGGVDGLVAFGGLDVDLSIKKWGCGVFDLQE
jgi:hypothetical protein